MSGTHGSYVQNNNLIERKIVTTYVLRNKKIIFISPSYLDIGFDSANLKKMSAKNTLHVGLDKQNISA